MEQSYHSLVLAIYPYADRTGQFTFHIHMLFRYQLMCFFITYPLSKSSKNLNLMQIEMSMLTVLFSHKATHLFDRQ